MFASSMTFNGNGMMHSSFFPPGAFALGGLNSSAASNEAPLLLAGHPQDFRGVAGMAGKRSVSFEEGNGDDDLSDDCSLGGEKKRRLNVEQVKTLERNFEMGSKLEPERKMQLARALGLQPRQIAIWFQNRRARWKTKQLEKDYDTLRRQFDALKSENDVLQAQNKKLQAEILALKGIEATEQIFINKETEGSCSNRSENTSEIHLDTSRAPNTAIESTLDPNQGMQLFQSYRPAASNVSQILHNSIKIENGVQDESFSNMLIGLDDQTSFWAWSENHSFH